MTPPPEQLLLSLLALAVGHGVAVYMVRRHKPVAYASVVADEENEDVSESIYVQEVLPLAEKNHPELVKRIRAKARELASGGREITTDDIHEAMPLPAGIDGRVLGAAFYPRNQWLKRGYQPSRRRENHSRPIARWVLKQDIAA